VKRGEGTQEVPCYSALPWEERKKGERTAVHYHEGGEKNRVVNPVLSREKRGELRDYLGERKGGRDYLHIDREREGGGRYRKGEKKKRRELRG